MNSGILTEGTGAPAPSDFRLWHVYALLSMAAAAAAVWAARNTHPAALLLLSAAVLTAGFAALSAHRALAGFFGATRDDEPLGERAREALLREKALVLRAIKELEFDRAMGKIGDADFGEMSTRLRARALTLMHDLERADAEAPVRGRAAAAPRPACSSCRTQNEPDARFCKSCGRPLHPTNAERKADAQPGADR